MTSTKPKLPPGARYSIKETLAILGVCQDTLRKHSLLGNIERCYDVLGEVFYLSESIMAFWEKCQQPDALRFRRGRPPKPQTLCTQNSQSNE